MANVPGSRSMPHRATEAPQATSPSQPGDAVAIAHWGAACLLELLLERRIPLDIPFNVGCGFGHKEANYPTHKGLDFYMTPSDVPVKRSCGFQGIGVSGATVYPAFPGCSHQTTLAKVVYAQNAGGAVGNCVILEHTDNTTKSGYVPSTCTSQPLLSQLVSLFLRRPPLAPWATLAATRAPMRTSTSRSMNKGQRTFIGGLLANLHLCRTRLLGIVRPLTQKSTCQMWGLGSFFA